MKREVRPWKTRRTGTSTRSLPPWSWAWPITGDQALIVWRHGDDPEAAQVVRIVSAEELSEVLWQAGLLAQPEHEETTP